MTKEEIAAAREAIAAYEQNYTPKVDDLTRKLMVQHDWTVANNQIAAEKIAALEAEISDLKRRNAELDKQNASMFQRCLEYQDQSLCAEVSELKAALTEAKNGFDTIAYAHSMKAEFHERDWRENWQCTFDTAWNHRAKIEDVLSTGLADTEPELQALRAEVERLKLLVKNAPHASGCRRLWGAANPCTCWKSDAALSRNDQQSEVTDAER